MPGARALRRAAGVAALLGGFAAAPAAGQDPAPRTAAEIVRAAVEAAGGEVWQRPRTLRLSGHAEFFPFGRHEERLRLDTYRMARVFPVESEDARRANGQVRLDAAHGDSLFFRIAFDGVRSDLHLAERARPYVRHFEWSNNFGFGILRFAEGEGFRLERMADDEVDGRACHFIRVTDPGGRETLFAIDQDSHEIRMVAFDTDLGFHHRLYSDFARAPSGFLQPRRVRIFFGGLKWVDIRWEDFEVNAPLPDTLFAVEGASAR